MRLLKPVALAALLGQTAPALLAQTPTPATSAQRAPVATLTLEDAIAIARGNNPAFLQTANAQKVADAQVRSAYGALLPQSQASFSTRYQQSGQQLIQGVALSTGSDVVQSNYNLGLTYQLNTSTIIAPRAARANRKAAEADVTGAAEVLRSTVAQQYIAALQASARAALQDTLVETTRGQLELAKARVAVGAATILDTRRAEVALGQQEVAALTAHNLSEVEKLRLFQQMGVAQPDSVVLTTSFPVARPSFSLDSLMDLARRANPAVMALREREKASSLNVRMAQAQYTPTLFVSTGWGGNSFQYTNSNFPVLVRQGQLADQQAGCFFEDSIRVATGMPRQNCNAIVLTPEKAQQIRSANQQFPFRFQKAPMALFAQVSIPIFDNFQREQRVEEAQVGRTNAEYNLRARELQMTADVTQAYRNLVTAARTVELQEVNAARAREELSFAEERYRVGAATFLDVTTSRGTFVQAQVDRVNAIYDYHRAFAALEAAVGRPLR
jgi:outer membrane protein